MARLCCKHAASITAQVAVLVSYRAIGGICSYTIASHGFKTTLSTELAVRPPQTFEKFSDLLSEPLSQWWIPKLQFWQSPLTFGSQHRILKFSIFPWFCGFSPLLWVFLAGTKARAAPGSAPEGALGCLGCCWRCPRGARPRSAPEDCSLWGLNRKSDLGSTPKLPEHPPQ